MSEPDLIELPDGTTVERDFIVGIRPVRVGPSHSWSSGCQVLFRNGPGLTLTTSADRVADLVWPWRDNIRLKEMPHGRVTPSSAG